MKPNKKNNGIEITEISAYEYEGHFVADNKYWTCEIDGNDVPLALHIEVIDMYGATGEKEFKQYPYLFSVNIVAADPHESFADEVTKNPDRLTLIYDAVSYMGGVPVDHKLLSMDSINQKLMQELKAKDAKMIHQKADFGTFAAQNGKGSEFVYPQFKTAKAAHDFALALINNYGSALMTLVGFTLDQPINMMGEDGWGVITKQVEGK